MTDQLDQIEEDIRDLKDWAARHEDEHTADKRLLASFVSTLDTHEGNHHGPPGPLVLARNGGLIAFIASAVIIVAEVIRYVAL